MAEEGPNVTLVVAPQDEAQDVPRPAVDSEGWVCIAILSGLCLNVFSFIACLFWSCGKVRTAYVLFMIATVYALAQTAAIAFVSFTLQEEGLPVGASIALVVLSCASTVLTLRPPLEGLRLTRKAMARS